MDDLITRVITGPVIEPVTLSEAKLHLRVDTSADDALITALIAAAREMIEERTGLALLTQTRDALALAFPAERYIELLYPPVQSVTGVYYTETDGSSEQTLSAAAYTLSVWNARITLKSGYAWPSGEMRVRVRYVCGYTAAASVPQRLRQAVLLLIGHWYENREATQNGTVLREIPLAVEALINLERRTWGF